MRQKGQLVAYGFELVEQSGPAHAPVFVFRGWMIGEDGAKQVTDPVTASSKKDGESAAAKALVATDAQMRKGENK
jgi:dsRNA-specific ribonuclease